MKNRASRAGSANCHRLREDVSGCLRLPRENFPGSKTAERVVGAISVILAVVAIGTAVYATSHEHHKKGEETAVPHLPV